MFNALHRKSPAVITRPSASEARTACNMADESTRRARPERYRMDPRLHSSPAYTGGLSRGKRSARKARRGAGRSWFRAIRIARAEEGARTGGREGGRHFSTAGQSERLEAYGLGRGSIRGPSARRRERG